MRFVWRMENGETATVQKLQPALAAKQNILGKAAASVANPPQRSLPSCLRKCAVFVVYLRNLIKRITKSAGTRSIQREAPSSRTMHAHCSLSTHSATAIPSSNSQPPYLPIYLSTPINSILISFRIPYLSQCRKSTECWAASMQLLPSLDPWRNNSQ